MSHLNGMRNQKQQHTSSLVTKLWRVNGTNMLIHQTGTQGQICMGAVNGKPWLRPRRSELSAAGHEPERLLD
jgi:hypothetical protein